LGEDTILKQLEEPKLSLVEQKGRTTAEHGERKFLTGLRELQQKVS